MKNYKRRAIGVLGGMGPQASRQFYELLISHAQKDYGAVNNDQFPEIYLASIPVPDFISEESNKSKALEMLTDRIRKMDQLPISFYCLACNTAHLLMDELRLASQKPIVSLLEEVPIFLKQKKIKKVGLLATPTTIKTKMYQYPLENAGIELLVPNSSDTEQLGIIIKDTVGGKNYESNSILVQEISKRMLERGAEGILESCTEIPLIFPKQHLVPVYDTLEILAQAVLKKYYLLK